MEGQKEMSVRAACSYPPLPFLTCPPGYNIHIIIITNIKDRSGSEHRET